MDEGMLIIANIVGVFCFISYLNRFRYTIPVVATIINTLSHWNYSQSENEYYIEMEYVVGGTRIKNKKFMTRREYYRYRKGKRISLRLLPNNPYKCIVVHSGIVFTFKFFIILAIVLDVYEYLYMHDLLHLFF